MAYYQTFKTINRDLYCSSYTVKNHTEGAAWVGECMAHFGIQANQLLGKPEQAKTQPGKATIWP